MPEIILWTKSQIQHSNLICRNLSDYIKKIKVFARRKIACFKSCRNYTNQQWKTIPLDFLVGSTHNHAVHSLSVCGRNFVYFICLVLHSFLLRYNAMVSLHHLWAKFVGIQIGIEIVAICQHTQNPVHPIITVSKS